MTKRKSTDKDPIKDQSEPTAGSSASTPEGAIKRTKKGQFAPGSARPAGAGRKIGTPNRTTTEFRNYFGTVLSKEIDSGRIENALLDLSSLNSEKYLAAIFKLATFNVPALQNIEFTGEVSASDPFTAHMMSILGISNDIDSKK